MNCFPMKWVSQFAAAVLALMVCPFFAMGQGTVPVTATCGAPNPSWVPDGVESDTTLTATTTAPSSGSGQTLILQRPGR